MCLKRQEVLQVQMHDGLQGPPDEGRDEDQNEEVLIAAWLRFERKVLWTMLVRYVKKYNKNIGSEYVLFTYE